MLEMAHQERALVVVRARVGTIPGAGPQENSWPREAGSRGRQVDLDRSDDTTDMIRG